MQCRSIVIRDLILYNDQFLLFEFFVVWRCSIWRWKRTKYLGYFHSWTPRLYL